ncbi:MAG: Ni/Fe hydrogenase subunit alpha [Deltaproteobacteria bacterium]|nr:Ni/Fe hydrogenase subunit alpha [Deltaproteobacteria bacterium]MBW2020446.1 Ni/Fe hydrogenase subunit alpha [Deltaproteobacteria bacterium]MBW2074945.1 Ni/Fe hydrogenase subunit alpha [Deltaproteobacteria bacterium]
MSRRITIDPITRLEGHGKINIFLDGKGDVERAYLQIPDFRGFEKFCEGRAVEEMPTLTQKICGVCPTAHHTASSKALDDLFGVDPPPAARKIRELMYNAFMFEDHLLHFYFLGGPDFIVGPDAPSAKRNILGVIDKVGVETGKKLIDIRKRVRGVNGTISGSALYPVCGLPGGISKAMTEENKTEIQSVTKDAVEFAKFTLKIFDDVVLKNKAYADLLTGDVFFHRTYYMGLVDDKGKVNFYDGKIRVVDPQGKAFVEFEAKGYLKHLEERIEPWSYLKISYLKNIGWKGFIDGRDSGVYRVGPLARLNAADGMATPLAQAEYEKMLDALGGKPVHNTLAYHWARLIEALYAAERMNELAGDGEITSPKVRNLPNQTPKEGTGACEAPRGTLFHHYKTDKRGIIKKLNMVVATQNNAAPLCMSIEKAARAFIKGGNISDGILNLIEMAFRAYDPCLACATHCLPGKIPTIVNVYDKEKKLITGIETSSALKGGRSIRVAGSKPVNCQL